MLHELWGLGEQRNRAFRMIMRVICLVLAFFKKRESSSQQVDFLIVENKGERLVKTSPNIKDTLHLCYVFTHARVSLIGKMIVRAKWFAVVTCMILHRTRAWSAPSFTGLRSARQACLHAFTRFEILSKSSEKSQNGRWPCSTTTGASRWECNFRLVAVSPACTRLTVPP